ncbi:YgdI/YgdR family lipoprotein [Pseudodesulfovibrio cashew]|uniref:YgdI/YgdR family lipoprotein n=1 Tax=Pseudodesulfovibrio cashew TaxID=2678688 RepID=A0A6I6JTS9_9BACT|nr:YgdI/YgdR family lipoprotein [Pseudodesulfovibrio cashew]QGY41094.1 YgdI/YgdR family lipoprotein [Pseudodesulfovibrio cashew]
MYRLITFLMTLLLSLFLLGCGAKQYEVTTKTGKSYTTYGTPEYDVRSETYKFKNDKGKEVILNQEDIEVIQEKE